MRQPDRAAAGANPDPVDGPLTGDDRPILEGHLAWQRVTLLNICAGLNGTQLPSRPLASSSLSVLGLVRHLAKVERIWFRRRAAGQAVEPMWDPAFGKDFDFEATDPATTVTPICSGRQSTR